eukprot:1057528-Pyramimonas_sp.AAC.1
MRAPQEAGKVPEGHEGPGRQEGQAYHAAGHRRPGRSNRLRLGRRREGAEEPDQSAHHRARVSNARDQLSSRRAAP